MSTTLVQRPGLVCYLAADFSGGSALDGQIGGAISRPEFCGIHAAPLGEVARVCRYLAILLMVFMQDTFTMHGFSREVDFFMFDRTPYEVLMASLLAVCVTVPCRTGATILRVLQLILFTAVPVMLGILVTGMFSFKVINILPLLPQSMPGVLQGVFHSWQVYFGYEIILVFLPLVYRVKTQVSMVVAGVFTLLIVFYIFLAMLIIGVLTMDTAKNVSYPLLTVIRCVDIPGTFLERLDTYFMVAWIQERFIAQTVILYVMAKVLTLQFGYADHRPWVLALAPLLFLGGDVIHSNRIYEMAGEFGCWLGLAFSLGVIPASYALAWWKRRRQYGKVQEKGC